MGVDNMSQNGGYPPKEESIMGLLATGQNNVGNSDTKSQVSQMS